MFVYLWSKRKNGLENREFVIENPGQVLEGATSLFV